MKQALRIVPFLVLAAAQSAVCQSRSFSVTVTGAGKPMLLIPGLECPGAVWDQTVAHFKTRYQVHALTLAGFGGAPAIPGLSLATVRDDVIRYIRENQLDHPVIAGHSLGGFLAFWIAATAPELPGRVIAVDGVPFLPALFNKSATVAESRDDAERMRQMYASMGPKQMEAMARMALTHMISEPKNIDIAAGWAAQSDGAFVGQVVYDLMTTDLRPEMAHIRVPVLVIAAGKTLGDQASGAYEAQLQAIPVHRVMIASKALHFIMFDDPAFLLSAMDSFLEDGSHAR